MLWILLVLEHLLVYWAVSCFLHTRCDPDLLLELHQQRQNGRIWPKKCLVVANQVLAFFLVLKLYEADIGTTRLTQENFDETMVGLPRVDERDSLLALLWYLAVSAGKLLGAVGVQEVGFYALHRLFHTRRLYAMIHRVHHEWDCTLPWVAFYAHPVEHLVVNMVPVVAGMRMFRMDLRLAMTWIHLASISSLVAHCGFLQKSVPHDVHHRRRNCYFGNGDFMDLLFGTTAEAVSRSRRLDNNQ